MIKVSVLYPGGAGTSFDMDYYLNRHIPMVRAKLGAACKSAAFQTAFGPHAGAIMGDIPNYTNVQPTIQVSEVRL
jgi:hypothetical protein